jgi:hypothetical protein
MGTKNYRRVVGAGPRPIKKDAKKQGRRALRRVTKNEDKNEA